MGVAHDFDLSTSVVSKFEWDSVVKGFEILYVNCCSPCTKKLILVWKANPNPNSDYDVRGSKNLTMDMR